MFGTQGLWNGILYVREEQWFACWAHDPEIVSSNLTFNNCTFKACLVFQYKNKNLSIRSKALNGYLNIKKIKDVTNEMVLTSFRKNQKVKNFLKGKPNFRDVSLFYKNLVN